MPAKILSQFQDQYGKEKGKRVYYATANKQKRDPETFKKAQLISKLASLMIGSRNADWS